MFYVADTHAWVFYLLDRLPERADEVFSQAELGRAFVFVPTIALAECVYLVEEGYRVSEEVLREFQKLLKELGR